MAEHNNTSGLKTQESSDPIDRYIAEHSLRLTREQNELVEYSQSLPGKNTVGIDFNVNFGFLRLFITNAWCSR